MAHEYIRSRALMNQLEADLGLISLYSGSAVDPVNRLQDLPEIGLSQHRQFRRFVNSSINIQTGMLTLYVRALSPQAAMEVSEQATLRVAERVNALSSELSEARITRADAAVAAARAALLDAQANVTQLQISSGEADPQTRIQGVYRTIAQLENEVEDLRAKITEMRIANHEDSPQTQRLIEFLGVQTQRIEDLRNTLVSGGATSDDTALNALLLDYEQAILQVRIAQEALTVALSSQFQVREKAALGRSQFQVVVPPTPAERPTHPNVLNAVLICFFTTLSALSLIRLLRRSPLA
jgi:capsule polysaccharide export protein KpsE/RkpR